MDLRKLRYFVGIAEAGGFRRAAEMLFVAQPSLSKHIRELERELDVKLFERGNFGVHLTAEGRSLLLESKIILEHVDGLRTSLAHHTRSLRGTVRIGAPSSVAALLFGPLAQRLHGVYPDLHLVCSGDGSRLLNLLEANEIDTAIITRVSSGELGAAWKSDRLVREQTFLIGRDDAPDLYGPVCLDDVIRLPLVLTPMPNSRRAQMQRLANAAGIKLNVVAEAETLGAHVSFVRQGLGFAVLPYSAASLMKVSAPVKIVPIRDSWSLRLLVRRADRAPSPALVVVNGLIVELFEEMVENGVFQPGAAVESQQ